MNADFYSKRCQSLITSGVSFRLRLSFQYTNMKTFLRNCVGENVESRTEKNVNDQKKNTAH